MISVTEFNSRLARIRALAEAQRDEVERWEKRAKEPGKTGLERKTCQSGAKSAQAAADAYDRAARLMETGV